MAWGGWNSQNARNLFDNCLELLAAYDPHNLRPEAEKWSRRFMTIQASGWGMEMVVQVLMERIFKERMNFEHEHAVSNTQKLAQLHLDLTDQVRDQFKWGRTQVMNILSDLAYFEGREEEALEWAERCQQENPADRFSSIRRKFLQERRAVQYQIRRFHHDTNTTFAGLQTLLQKMQHLPEAGTDPLYSYIKKIESNIDRLRGVHRFVQERQAEPDEIDPLEIVKKLKLDYDSKADIELLEYGEHQFWLADQQYLSLAVDNVLKNSVEAFEGRSEDRSRRIICIEIHYQQQSLCVQDNAGGIEPQYMERIFDPFVSSKGVRQTTGLGLYHAREAMKKNRGSITLAPNQPAHGARFEITLHR